MLLNFDLLIFKKLTRSIYDDKVNKTQRQTDRQITFVEKMEFYVSKNAMIINA
jgi:hypothetical protein